MAESQENGEEKFVAGDAIFTTDPSEWMQYVYKEVCVTTKTGALYTGRVYTVDPVSQAIVLANFDGQTLIQYVAVMGHAIESIAIMDDNIEKYKDTLDCLFRSKDDVLLGPEELDQKKEKLRLWLLKNRIPVVISGENSEILMVSDVLSIEPPYGIDDCQSTNEIVLGRIQGLVTSMPKDAHQW